MKRYIGVAFTINMTINGDRLSPEIIEHILKTQKEVPVTMDYTGIPIGRTIKIVKYGSQAACAFEVDETKVLQLENCYIVPMLQNVQYRFEGGAKVITSGELTSMALTYLPADPSLSKIHTF